MSGKSRRSSQTMTIGSSHLSGYSGPLEVMSFPRRSWWQRLLRRPATVRRSIIHANIDGDSARFWRRG